MPKKISVNEPIFDDSEVNIAQTILDSGLLSSSNIYGGKYVKIFEKQLSELLDCKYAVAVNSGTSALYASLLSLGIKSGDEVIVPSHTFIASSTCIDQVGATPVFVDVEEEYHTLCPDAVESAISSKTKAIIAVHLYGQPINPRIFEIAQSNEIPLIEDSAQAHGAEINGRRIGGLGDLATFSFFPSKNMAVGGDGGALLANRPDLADKVGMAIDHGRIDKYRHDFLGSNFRLSEIQCAIGRIQLKHLDDWVARRNQIASKYNSAFSELSWTTIPVVRSDALHAWHQYVLRVPDREKFMNHMDANGVSTGIHYPLPCHLQPLYQNHPQHFEGALPITEAICNSVVSIPVHPHLSDDEVEKIISAVLNFNP